MRQKICMVGAIFFFLISVFVFSAPDAEAVPAFARQTGLACNTCHFQHFPALNAFGRSFKSGGFTMVGGQSMIEGDMLSLPSTLNASVILKVRYQKSNGDSATGTNMGELQFPDEASIFLGGRVGENIGFLLEGQIKDEAAPFFASFKMPFVRDVAGSKFSIIPFSTDSLGAAFGFELLNTGAVRNVRVMEHRKELSAQQFVGTDGAAEGIAFVLANNKGFVNASFWTPNSGTVAVNGFSHYLRAAATPAAGNLDIGAGIQYWGGTSSTDSGDIDTRALALDAQVQGSVGSMPLGVYVTYAKADKSGATQNQFNSSTTDDTSAFSIAGEIGIIPDKVSLTAAYRAGDKSGDSDNGLLLAALYQAGQNLQLQFNHTLYSGDAYDPKPAAGDQLTTLVLFTAF